MKYKDCLAMFDNIELIDSYTNLGLLREEYRYKDYELTFLVIKGEVLMIDIHNEGLWIETINKPTKDDIKEFFDWCIY